MEKKLIKKSGKSTNGNSGKRDQYTVVLEYLRSDFKIFGKALSGLREENGKKLDDIEKTQRSHTLMIGQLMIDASEIKNDLKQKIDRNEFAKLEKRVVMLERRRR